MSFKDDFLWGASTAAYQIEGAAFEDGRGESVWDSFCKKDGAVKNGENGDIACDHYHRYKDDVKMFSDIGLNSYRFSLSWTRLLPDGVGEINYKGVDFYDRLVDELLEKNIKPSATLFHWDYPQKLYDQGGWLNRNSSDWFEEYASLAVECLGDRVKMWNTQNEPQCFIDLGHKTGYHAPGDKLPIKDVLTATHNSLLAHGKAYRAMKSMRPDIRVGYAPVAVTFMPKDPVADLEIAKKRMFGHTYDGLFTNSWFMDPIFKGEYPVDGLKLYGADMPKIETGDMEIINSGADFLSANIYHGDYVQNDGSEYGEVLSFEIGAEKTAMDWQVTPEALYWGPKFLYERYGKPIIITENGMAGTDFADKNGYVDDPYRISYLNRYISQLKKASAEGVDIEGYFLWSAMDNFEWAEGYSKRFGIVSVDYETLKRVRKKSASWYSEVIANNGANLEY